jgi:Fic family protein
MPIKWIWQHEQYGTFPYRADRLEEALSLTAYTRGKLDTLLAMIDASALKVVEADSIIEEIIDSSKIEGEYLRRESVRASVAKAIQAYPDTKHADATRQTDALVELLIDARLNQTPLDIERLHGWHNALFAHSRGEGVRSITIGAFRAYDDMRVKEGPIGAEVTKYLAPPHTLLRPQIETLLAYVRTSTLNPYIKSALVHLWFVSIHPYDDGNGRIARALADYVLANDGHELHKAYSISSAIAAQRDAYYEMLDHTTNLHKNRHFDFTQWIDWHTRTLQKAMEKSIESVRFVIDKTRFWDTHRHDDLKPRQIALLEHFLTPKNHTKPIRAQTYMTLTAAPKTTAARDIKRLLALKCIEPIPELKGRNTAYRLILPQASNRSLKERYEMEKRS